MQKSLPLYCFIILIICCMPAIAAAQVTSVRAEVDKNPAMADESIVLKVTANGDADRDAFDPSSLADDFVVGRTSISSQTRMVNFQTSQSTTWTTILIPKKKGKFTIGPFSINGKQTQPIEVMVIPPVTTGSGKPRDVFVTAQVNQNEVYLQQQLTYTVKIHLFADLQRGSLQAPVLEDAVIRPLGEDKEYSDIVDGIRYRIIERNFAIIPQKSGEFSISGPLFEGEIVDNKRQSFAYFNQSKPVNRVAPEIKIKVLPAAPNFIGHWLPSEMVQLHEEWQPDGEFTVGEPVTRTLTLTALGLVEEQLPEIDRHYPPDFKIYPDQAATTTVVKDLNLVSQRVENIAVIPTRAGQFVLPEVKVPWFNTVTKTTEFATLPARSITVVEATGANSLPPAATSSVDSPIQPVGTRSANELTQNENAIIQKEYVYSWWSSSSWVLLGLWLGTILLWWIWPTKSTSSVANNTNSDEQEKALWAKLQSALSSNEGNRIYAALQKWLACVCRHNTSSLSVNSVLKQPELAEQINQMFEQRYTASGEQWTSQELKRQLIKLRTKLSNPKDKVVLDPLYTE